MQKLRVIETFSGIGSQAKALQRLKERNYNFDYDVVATVEWEIGAMYAYDILHNGPQDLSKYDHLTKEDILKLLKDKNLSSDGKKPMSFEALNRMSITQLKAIWHSIESNNNLIDISTVSASQLPDADLLTYSFPCQDLSISSYWHKNLSGINKGANNRSGLLWEIERILHEYKAINKPLPKFLLMENVTAINSPLHSDNFELWKAELRKMGYQNHVFNLNAKDYDIPQSRVRTYMVSILVEGNKYADEINQYMTNNTDLGNISKELPDIASFLRLNYEEREEYFQEALNSIPNYTESRKVIFNDSAKLANGRNTNGIIAKTITTKQDRNPNAGLIVHGFNLDEKLGKAPYRYLTPRETFLLMGFDEADFDLLIENNIKITKTRKFLSDSKLLKLTGNSIVVNVLEAIFKEMYHIDRIYFQKNKISAFQKKRA